MIRPRRAPDPDCAQCRGLGAVVIEGEADPRGFRWSDAAHGFTIADCPRCYPPDGEGAS